MSLAGLSIPASLPRVEGIDLSAPDAVAAMASWYLASVIDRSQDWIRKHDVERLEGRDVKWSANVGVPVEYCDSAALGVFENVLKVAWAWVSTNDRPRSLGDLMRRYEHTKQSIEDLLTDCHAVPEIAAAAQSYLTSRAATRDKYIYFDIGAGTIDGVGFRYNIKDGRREVHFHWGRVAPLGVAALVHGVAIGEQKPMRRALVNNKLSPTVREQLERYVTPVQQLVGEVVMESKKREGDWLVPIDRRPRAGWQGRLNPSEVDPLPVFVGGGGAGSAWYRSTIEATHACFKQWNAGIPPYDLREVPVPQDLRLNGLKGSAFRRFAVAYGLSVPLGEGPDISLPSQSRVLPRLRPVKNPDIIDFLDTKDME